jgi:catechol 2,3-dioxygenase-like lactoylglutathione lyase family enzyme
MTLKKRGLVPKFYVSDIGLSRAFYTDVLGFDAAFERPEDGFVYLAREEAELMLDAIETGRTWLTAPLETPFGRGVNLQIWTEEVASLYRCVEAANATVFFPWKKNVTALERCTAETNNSSSKIQMATYCGSRRTWG